jgi:hypothetical protein
MEDANRLSALLSVLSGHWDRLSEDMDPQQLSELRDIFSQLETRMEKSGTAADIESAASEFFQAISRFESLRSLIDAGETTMRSGSLPLPEEEIRIKIINYCAIVTDRLKDLKNDRNVI